MDLLQLTIAAILVGIALGSTMALAWYIQRITSNSGWVDLSWSLGVGVIACTAAAWPFGTNWPHWRQIAVATLAASWSLRLGIHIALRTQAVPDDPRYGNLIAQWGHAASRRLFWFVQSQAAVGTVLVLSIVLAAQNPAPSLRIQDLVGLATLAAALIGEAIADHQLQAFKADEANRRSVCDIGLWGRSRHPNYFFEWLSWVAYAIVAVDFSGHNPYGWLALTAPISMYWVLVHVSGIPPLEAHMLRKYGPRFREYQRRTPVFFPLPRMSCRTAASDSQRSAN